MAVAISTTAIALFSCSVTQAFVASPEKLIYSGSTSWATDEPGPKILTPDALRALIWLLKGVKDASWTVGVATPPARLMILTEPTGSVV